MVHMLDKTRLVHLTHWLRPFVRWSARFALNSPQWLPELVRRAPLRLASWVLRCYHLALR